MTSQIYSEIKDIFNQMDVDYIRATVDEANYELQNRFVKNSGIAIQTDQTTVSVTGGFSPVATFPLEIHFVFKEANQDDSLVVTDKLVEKAEDLANEFYSRLNLSELIPKAVPLDTYELQRLEAFRLFDTVVSGVLFTTEISVFHNLKCI